MSDQPTKAAARKLFEPAGLQHIQAIGGDGKPRRLLIQGAGPESDWTDVEESDAERKPATPPEAKEDSR